MTTLTNFSYFVMSSKIDFEKLVYKLTEEFSQQMNIIIDTTQTTLKKRLKKKRPTQSPTD